MMPDKEYTHWKGRLLAEYTKDELIKIIQQLANSYERRLSDRERRIKVLLGF